MGANQAEMKLNMFTSMNKIFRSLLIVTLWVNTLSTAEIFRYNQQASFDNVTNIFYLHIIITNVMFTMFQ